MIKKIQRCKTRIAKISYDFLRSMKLIYFINSRNKDVLICLNNVSDASYQANLNVLKTKLNFRL